MDIRRTRFLLAFGLFVVWVVALTAMAVTSARAPRAAQPAAAVPRG